jgi:hypothetical protein
MREEKGADDVPRDDLDPGDVLSAISGPDPVVDIVSVDIVRPEVIVVMFSLHVSLPEIDERIDKEEGRYGSEDQLGDYRSAQGEEGK